MNLKQKKNQRAKTDSLKQLTELSADPSISAVERQLLAQSQLELTKGTYEEQVATSLESQLAHLALKQELTPVLVPFLSELSRQHLGTGKRGMVYFD
ncbi:hypothetical protein C5Z26_09880 [Lactobacillus sp. CBA3606]|uniref:bacteriocin immunity protein n=1 Tax=Lactobacillus sp. CBA3606 TaxID=2099789 RepID=UPI000CFACD49|nr:bacteriocin immunity protein [Lactobacillus sp. CBA3606]AVK64405.1 hypothetical protein C5Z26_09880 [Lactobacillus sp. CBA3606]